MAEVIEFSSWTGWPIEPRSGYRAFERSGQPEQRLFLVFRDRGAYLILRYAELESIGSVPGIDVNRAMLLRFHGSVIRDVRIEGRRLLDLVPLLRCEQIRVIEETPWAWDNGNDTVVSIRRITVREARR